MTSKIHPFKGVYYDKEKVGDLSNIVTPPYDVILPEEAKQYFAKSPYNFAHIIMPKNEVMDYKKERDLLRKWLNLGILKKEERPCFYLYRQIFDWNGKSHARDTFMCAVQLSEYSKGEIRPHENTYGKYKADRLEILKQTQFNLSHVFAMARDEEGFLNNQFESWAYGAHLLKAKTPDDVMHTIWRISVDQARDVTDFLSHRPVYIIDGHHRFESSLNYARESGTLGKDKPSSCMIFAISGHRDPALLVLPTHRAISKLPKKPDLTTLESHYDLRPSSEEELKCFVSIHSKGPGFVLLVEGKLFHCTPRNKTGGGFSKSLETLPVAWSDHHLLSKLCGIDESNRSQFVTYVKDVDRVWKERSLYEWIIFHTPPRVEQILDVADEREFMPQKSTYFYPKLGAGLIFRELL